jgi:hypothetical protein
MTWLEIAERLRNATDPDREIDAAIALASGWTFQKMKRDRKPHWRAPGETRDFMTRDLPRFTASLDAQKASCIGKQLPI